MTMIAAQAETIVKIASVEEEYYVPSDAQYEPYCRVDMFGEDGMKYSFVIEKRLDTNGMPVIGRTYTLNDMNEFGTYMMAGMFEYYDFTSVNFVKSQNANGLATYNVKVTDERNKSYTLVYEPASTGTGETITRQAKYGQAAYFGNATGVNGDWLLRFADADVNIFADINVIATDGEHIAGKYTVEGGTLIGGESSIYAGSVSEALVNGGTLNLSCVETESGPMYNVTAALLDAVGRTIVINRTIIAFEAYDAVMYQLYPNDESKYLITLKDTETSGINDITVAPKTSVRKVVRNGRIVIEHNGKSFNIDGTLSK